ncbi:protein NLRC3-like [Chanodichthys erythropterus]|uniref:protein NLRC3-like n=1 Tax=Chanodichthys erythropterus TaxID=933992 RepID=UPI00351F5C67
MSKKRGKDSLSKMSLLEKQSIRSGSHVSSSVSLKSDQSIGNPPNFSEETPSAIERRQLDSDFQTHRENKNFKDNLLSIFQDLESKIITFLKNELEKFKKILQKENPQYFVKDFNENRCSIKEAALDLTLHYLRELKHDEAADTLEDELVFIHQLKCNIKKKYQCVFEGIAKQGDSTLLNNIYTDLYITQGGSEQVNNEHEVRQIEASRCHQSKEIPIECKNMFYAPEQDKEIRTLLTKGVAGIGKTISVQKFVLDWAEGKENQDISFIFPLPFREMNLKEKEKISLIDLITHFFTETKGLNFTRRNNSKVLFILDGLDECRFPLKFDGNEMWHDVSSPASLDVLLTNLIRGNLLPSALIWITTRPAAACKIPPDCIDRVTEVRGFNDAQKEEYFRKRFTDEKMAEDIIDHVKKSKSVFIMCHIPVFCWISATVLQNILEEKINNPKKQTEGASETLQESNTEDTPKTLTQMYTHFLRFQIQQSRRKYDGEYTADVSWDKEAISSLGKLAFHQLERNNLIFYDTDLKDCGIDVEKASVYSGMCTQIFKEETGIILGTMYCFVHLSIQEFIAALYAHLFLDINMKNVFDQESTEQENKNKTIIDLLKIAVDMVLKSDKSTEQENKNKTMIDLLKIAVDKALKSDNGHLDLFLRFLLGLSLQSNRRLLKGMLTQQDGNDQSKEVIVQYIKQKLEDNLSPERSINLFYCLNELNDQTLVKEIQTHLSNGSLSSADLSPAQWSAVAFVLLTSEEELEDFELQKFKKSDECLIRLLAVIKACKRALLNDCNLTDRSCSALATVLGSETNLKELNMNNNNLQDSGVKLLCTGLENCKLEILRLSDCSITEEGYKALASALKSNPSHLIELDLTGNDPGQSGVKELIHVQKNWCHSLKTLRILQSPDADEACQYVREILGKNPLLLRELNLSGRKLGDTRVNQIAALLQDKHCEVNTLILSDCSITEEGYKALASALRSNPSHLIELDLTGNDPGQSGVKELNDILQDQNCQLKTLRFLSPAAEEACKYLTELVGKNPLLLRELNLSGHELGDTRVNQIAALLQDKHCQFNTITLSDCSITEEGYKALASALRSNPSHLIELDLTGNDPGQSGVKELNDLLQDQNCQLKTLSLCGCSFTEKQCYTLTSALFPNRSHLRELDLSGNQLKNTGAKHLSDVLKDSCCQLERLRLRSCRMTDKGCSAVTSALILNPSHLRELDLSGNEPGDSGVKSLSDLLMNPQCKLENLQLCKCSIREKQCVLLTSALKSNPSHLRELNLSGNKLGDSGVGTLGFLLSRSQCKLEKLHLCGCSITEKQCLILTQHLCLSLSHLRELNFSGNQIENQGVKILCEVLKDSRCKLERLSLNECGITDVSSLTQSLTNTKALQFLKELDLSKNNIRSSRQQLIDLIQDSSCNLSLEEEGWISSAVNTAANVFSSIGGWLTRSKAQEDPVKSAAQEKPPS